MEREGRGESGGREREGRGETEEGGGREREEREWTGTEKERIVRKDSKKRIVKGEGGEKDRRGGKEGGRERKVLWQGRGRGVREGCECFNVSLSFSGRHKQEDSLFEEMLQVSQAIVSYMYMYLQMPAYIHYMYMCMFVYYSSVCMHVHTCTNEC